MIARLIVCLAVLSVLGCSAGPEKLAVDRHPADTSNWSPLFGEDLAEADYDEGVWTLSDGVLTASKDQAIWTTVDYENFVLDLEFKTGPNANSGVILYATDTKNWIPGAIEVQILDDGGEKWKNISPHGRCGALYGHVPPTLAGEASSAKPAGAWNRMTITAVGQQIDVVLNGTHVTTMNLAEFTNATVNPDGSKVPKWLSKPKAELATKGKIGLQGKHGDADIYFRNLRIMQLQQ